MNKTPFIFIGLLAILIFQAPNLANPKITEALVMGVSRGDSCTYNVSNITGDEPGETIYGLEISIGSEFNITVLDNTPYLIEDSDYQYIGAVIGNGTKTKTIHLIVNELSWVVHTNWTHWDTYLIENPLLSLENQTISNTIGSLLFTHKINFNETGTLTNGSIGGLIGYAEFKFNVSSGFMTSYDFHYWAWLDDPNIHTETNRLKIELSYCTTYPSGDLPTSVTSEPGVTYTYTSSDISSTEPPITSIFSTSELNNTNPVETWTTVIGNSTLIGTGIPPTPTPTTELNPSTSDHLTISSDESTSYLSSTLTGNNTFLTTISSENIPPSIQLTSAPGYFIMFTAIFGIIILRRIVKTT